MKILIFTLLTLAGNAAQACPPFSGTYRWTSTTGTISSAGGQMIITQTGCKTMTIDSTEGEYVDQFELIATEQKLPTPHALKGSDYTEQTYTAAFTDKSFEVTLYENNQEDEKLIFELDTQGNLLFTNAPGLNKKGMSITDTYTKVANFKGK